MARLPKLPSLRAASCRSRHFFFVDGFELKMFRVASLALSNFLATVVNFLSTPTTADFEQELQHTFDELPLDEQPSIVADTGCGDGTLLLKVFMHVRDHTARGRQLAARPLLMVGVDFNEASLVATAKTLREAGVPFETMFGDIGDPEPIHEGLCARFGAHGRDDILHVRSFLDHDRPFIPPSRPKIGRASCRERV